MRWLDFAHADGTGMHDPSNVQDFGVGMMGSVATEDGVVGDISIVRFNPKGVRMTQYLIGTLRKLLPIQATIRHIYPSNNFTRQQLPGMMTPSNKNFITIHIVTTNNRILKTLYINI